MNASVVCVFASNLHVEKLRTMVQSIRSKYFVVSNYFGGYFASPSGRTYCRKTHPKKRNRPSFAGKLQSAQKHNIIWGQSRKYTMGQKQEIQAEANDENITGSHDVGRPSAAPHHMVAAAHVAR